MVMIREPSKDPVIRERDKRQANDFKWIHNNMHTLTTKYPKKYIAVMNQKIKYNADSMEEMMLLIDLAGNEVSDYIIQYLSLNARRFLCVEMINPKGTSQT